jgi:hypothetical protein
LSADVHEQRVDFQEDAEHAHEHTGFGGSQLSSHRSPTEVAVQSSEGGDSDPRPAEGAADDVAQTQESDDQSVRLVNALLEAAAARGMELDPACVQDFVQHLRAAAAADDEDLDPGADNEDEAAWLLGPLSAAFDAAEDEDDQTTSAYSALREKLFDPVRPWT